MEKVILSPASEADFHQFQNPLEICDSQGQSVGLFLPTDRYKKLLVDLKIPFSKEELERRRNVKGGETLQAFWQRMGQS